MTYNDMLLFDWSCLRRSTNPANAVAKLLKAAPGVGKVEQIVRADEKLERV